MQNPRKKLPKRIRHILNNPKLDRDLEINRLFERCNVSEYHFYFSAETNIANNEILIFTASWFQYFSVSSYTAIIDLTDEEIIKEIFLGK